MKIFVTGASGFIGSAIVECLIDAGHQVIGLARSEQSAIKIRNMGAEVLSGSLEKRNVLKDGALRADGIIHTAFIHDFSQYEKANEVEKAAIDAMAEHLVGTGKPIVVASGLLGVLAINGVVTEESEAKDSPRSSEATAMRWATNGVFASVVRLPPSVHDKGDKGFVPFMIQQARTHGVAAYPGDGSNRWSAVHRLDAASLFQLAVEKPIVGALYNAVGEEGIRLNEIAGLIGERSGLPVASVTGNEMKRHFDWMSRFIELDCPATAIKTCEQLGWKPVQPGLLEDMRNNYF